MRIQVIEKCISLKLFVFSGMLECWNAALTTLYSSTTRIRVHSMNAKKMSICKFLYISVAML